MGNDKRKNPTVWIVRNKATKEHIGRYYAPRTSDVPPIEEQHLDSSLEVVIVELNKIPEMKNHIDENYNREKVLNRVLGQFMIGLYTGHITLKDKTEPQASEEDCPILHDPKIGKVIDYEFTKPE